MKRITLAFSVLSMAGLVFTSCKKELPTAPVADTELQTSKDASWALYTALDGEMIASFIADNALAPVFYLPAAGSLGSVAPVQDTTAKYISFAFNTTTCLDGRYREGSVVVDREIDTKKQYTPYANENSRYYRSFGYSERLTFSEYKVDGWKMTTIAEDGSYGQPVVVVNNMTIEKWNPATTNLSWNIKGRFKLVKDGDSAMCKVDLVKTLLNTSDPAVFDPSKSKPINWAKGKVSYSGTVTGYTKGKVPFSMVISPEEAIIRDFTCSPDVVGSVAAAGTTSMVVTNSQYHPFVGGVATMTTSTAYPRRIYYAGSETNPTPACDNSGAVLIKGISYPVDFRVQ